ncbi:E3 ubiquitin-protein ligase [Perilla frutescens var. frutescens]|nr:E3 ubiquitin-protein ligase [Perilla frutescens var. frutescens]
MASRFEVEKLTDKVDFGLWKVKMQALLIQQGLEEALKKGKPSDSGKEKAEKSEERAQIEAKAHSMIILCLEDKALREVARETTAIAVWERLSADHPKLISLPISSSTNSSKRNEFPTKKKSRPRLIRISTSEAKWHGNWNSEYLLSLRDLQLHDLSHDHLHKDDTNVFINLSIQKHAGLGLSVEGRIATCFTTKCCICCSPYLREISTTFKVWILPSTRTTRDSSHHQLPDIGGDDPSVIYVKPGYEADLDSLIQDTIRLATSVNETCSETCEKSEPKLHRKYLF